MSERPLTPEEVIGAMSYEEVQELLADLGLDPSRDAAERLKRAVRDLGEFEAAIEAFRPPRSRRAA